MPQCCKRWVVMKHEDLQKFSKLPCGCIWRGTGKPELHTVCCCCLKHCKCEKTEPKAVKEKAYNPKNKRREKINGIPI